ncbi:MAG: ABC transporter permease subunit [Anaerolineales bacterium]|nr:ABC transporter permease subunit [Anaerolineales bacterium]
MGLFTYIGRRFLFGLLVLLAIIYVSHFGLAMARGSGFSEAVITGAEQSVESISQFLNGDLGISTSATSTVNVISVNEILPELVIRSLGLLGAAMLIAIVVGLTLGILAVGRRRSGWSVGVLVVSIIGVSVPSFFAALILQILVIQLYGITGKSLIPVGGFGWDEHIILPALVLAARPIAQIARVTYGSISETLDQDHVRTARSKGLLERRVMSHHVIRNAAIPILTTIGLSLRFALSSLPVVELFFGWPGIGHALLKAIARHDDDLIVALVLCLGMLFVIVNLIIDITYLMLDPRLREAHGKLDVKERIPLKERASDLLFGIKDFIQNNPISKWWERRRAPKEVSPFRDVLEQRSITNEEVSQLSRKDILRSWIKGTLGNFPLVAGLIIVMGLVFVILFGMRLAPHSPYTTLGLTVVDGVLTVPPFEPNETFPWGTDPMGRDIMSLVLTGAWQTLRLAALAVLARIVVGFIFGAVAGWLNGRWIDRTLVSIAETISAFPTLILAMLLILAIGIKEGLAPFIIVFCFLGWGEVMLFIRGEVMAMRPKTFIESATAIGQKTPRIVHKHVLPNLVPALISIIALEMGAVLMLLGELGFIGIFIGGGAFAELDIGAAPYHYSDVPEWGALLSNVRIYARSYPWTALYPAMAFFVAILGFNLFGEGIRRLVADLGVRITKLVNRYTIAGVVVAVLVIGWYQGSTGALAIYQLHASTFEAERAYEHIVSLTSEDMNGRSLGFDGLETSAQWIADQFESLGLQAAGEKYTYFQPRTRSYEELNDVPQLSIEDGGSELIYHKDYMEFHGYFRVLGEARGKVRFFLVDEVTSSQYFSRMPALDDLDYSNDILVVLDARDAMLLTRVPHAGILVVEEDESQLSKVRTLSSRDPHFTLFGTNRDIGLDSPKLFISESVANRLLKGIGMTVDDLREKSAALARDEFGDYSTELTASLSVNGTIVEKAPNFNVLGHLPGTAGFVTGSSGSTDFQMDDKLIVVIAKFDSPPTPPDGQDYSFANDNASGVAVMLEAIRTLQESGYQPYKTFLFVAYSSEGLEGGEYVYPQLSRFLQTKFGFAENYVPEAIIELRGVGTGDGKGLIVASEGSLRLLELFEDAARRMGVRAKRGGEDLDLSVVFDTGSAFDSGEEAPTIVLSWEGWEETARTSDDTLTGISEDKLEKAGKTLALALMVMGREIQY